MMVLIHGVILFIGISAVRAQDQGDLRLYRGSASSGIVQVYDNNTWKTLCGSNFGQEEAEVVCVKLNYYNGTNLPNTAFGQLKDVEIYPDAFSSLGCETGDELSIFDCDLTQGASCPDAGTRYASVQCHSNAESVQDYSVKLADEGGVDSGYFSRVLVYKYHTWGHVCGQFWDDNDADVTCRQLGFLGGVASYKYTDWSIPVVVMETGCTGTEDSFTDCDLESSVDCLTDSVGEVVCYKTQKPQLQLVGGKAHYGHVVFSVDGMQGLMCAQEPKWSYGEAYTVCKTMGYTSGFVITGVEKETLTVPGTSDILIESLSCSGSEDAIFQCNISGWKNLTGLCSDISDTAAVYCYTTVRLVTPVIEQVDVHLGRVEILDNGYWRPVCADTFSQTEANMVCKQFDFTHAEITLPGNFGDGFQTPINRLTCDGTETTIANCTFNVGRCEEHSEHAALVCTQDNVPNDYNISISDGYHGYVQIERYGVTGHVCREGWDDADAAVLCRSLNYVTGFMFGTPKGKFDTVRRTPVWASSFTCNGGEDSLTDCGYQTNLTTDWSCAEDLPTAGVLCYSGKPPTIKVGKRGSEKPHTYRAEVYHDQSGWGTVCDESWSNLNAEVYCKELGYPSGKAARSGYEDGYRSLLVVMSGVQCEGQETSLLQCPNNGWRDISSSCSNHSTDAGVTCYSWVKTEPTTSFGAVLYHGKENYGLVCADGFDDNAATAVCREQSPFPFPYGMALCCSAAGPQVYSNFTLSDVSCTGTELSLKDCVYNDVTPVCSSGQYAAVACFDYPGQTFVLAADPVVKVTYLSQQGHVCTEQFTDADASVVCRQLGFSFSEKFKAAATDIWHKIRWLNGFGCEGKETRTFECVGLTWGQIGTCSWDSVAATRCSNSEEDMMFDIRIVNGSNISGRVELKIDNQWGTLCGNDLTKNEASVICKQLGYHDGVAMQPGLYGTGTGPIHLSGFQCEGNEESVADCIWSGYKSVSSLCDHSKDAAVMCFDNIQLTGSTTINYGRIEMFDPTAEDWVAVCDNSIFTNDAQIICQQLGYRDGIVQRGSPLGPTDTQILVTGVDCSNVAKCTFTLGECSSGRYAAVYCSDSTIMNENGHLRLPLDSYYGPVSVRRYGLWGHICSVGFDDSDASVVCGQLGYQSGQALSTYKTTGFPIIQGNVDCDGGESTVFECNRSPFVTDPGCYNVETVAAVMCYNPPGQSQTYADLDAETGKMMTVAGIEVNSDILRFEYNSFTNTDAVVYCKGLAYAGGEVYRSTQGGYGVTDIQCEGTEMSILQCPGTWDPSKNQGQQGDLAGVICYTAVRLVGGDPTFYGIVYTSQGVNSGPICSEGFDVIDANKACRSLYYDGGLVLCCSPFGTIQDQAILTNVQCTGSEEQFSDCQHDEVTAVDAEACKKNYAAVLCYNSQKSTEYQLYLSGNTEYTGHLIVSYMGVNGTICMDGWSDSGASVACKQLGYRRGVAYNAARPRLAPGPFWSSNVQCSGHEDALSDCLWTELGRVDQCMTSTSQAGVICFDNEGIFYRLGGTNEIRYGRVEIAINGEWRSICGIFWGQEESHVLCKMLGYSTGDVYSGAINGTLSGPVWEVNNQCDGTESNLNLCVSTGWRVSTVPSCVQHSNDAGTFCYKSVKLSTGVGRETDQGGVLLYHNGQWHSTCCEGFTDKSAAVVCRELGFKDGQALSCSSFGPLNQYLLLTSHRIGCQGDETDVKDCLVESSCQGNQYASVVCYSFLNTTEPTTTPEEKKGFDSQPVIIAVVVFIVLLLLAIIVAVCIIKYRRQKKNERSKETFDRTIVSEHNDGTIIARNILSDSVRTPEVPRVQYNRNTESGEEQIVYKDKNRPKSSASHNNHGYSNLYDNTNPHDEDTRDYDNVRDAAVKPSGPAANKTVINVSADPLRFDNHVYSNNTERGDNPVNVEHVYDLPKSHGANRSLSQQDEVQMSKDSTHDY